MSEEPRFDVEYSPFAVNEKARCYWDTDLRRKNVDFIRDVDAKYFSYLAETHAGNLAEGPRCRAHAAMALRSAYYHSVETLFALVFAGLQAPDCVVGWVQQYAIGDLKDLVGSVGGKPPRYLKIRPKTFTWEGIARTVLLPCYGRTDDAEEMITLFGSFWSRLAREFLSERHGDEYNSIKHGFRITPGSTGMNIAFQEPGKPGSFGRFEPLLEAEHGHIFYVPNLISKSGGARQLSLKRSFVNAEPEGVSTDLGIVSVSIHNVRTWLLIYHECRPADLTYKAYDFNIFRERAQQAWTSSGTYDPGLKEKHIKNHQFSGEQILETYFNPETESVVPRS